MKSRSRRRLERQLDALARAVPAAAPLLKALQEHPWALLRLPVGLLLVLGGILGFLPIVGFWMIPLGLLLIAIDLPLLRRPITAAVIRLRRRAALWRRRIAARRRRQKR